MTETTCVNLDAALAGLLDKYAVKPPGAWRIAEDGQVSDTGDDALLLTPGWAVGDAAPCERTVPLLPWRHERRFVELKRLIDDRTVAPLLMCRFACLTDGRRWPLDAVLYRELDLLEWLSGATIESLSASMAGSEKGVRSNLPERPGGCFAQIGPDPFFAAADVIVRLAGGAIGSVEAGTTLPAGAGVQDRHELIARRGVASDRVVDTQVAQSSVYAWTAHGNREHLDVDAELFGLGVEQVSVVRAAYDVLCEPAQVEALCEQHRRLRWLVALACESDRRQRRLTVDAEKGTGPICAKHPPGRSGKLDPSPFSPREGGRG